MPGSTGSMRKGFHFWTRTRVYFDTFLSFSHAWLSFSSFRIHTHCSSSQASRSHPRRPLKAVQKLWALLRFIVIDFLFLLRLDPFPLTTVTRMDYYCHTRLWLLRTTTARSILVGIERWIRIRIRTASQNKYKVQARMNRKQKLTFVWQDEEKFTFASFRQMRSQVSFLFLTGRMQFVNKCHLFMG